MINWFKGNAAFSGLSGIILIVFRQHLATIFKISSSQVFLWIGIVLLLFTFTIWIEIKKRRTAGFLLIILQDLLWVVGSILILLLDPWNISYFGNLIIITIAFIVMIFGLGQWYSLGKSDLLTDDSGVNRLIYQSDFKASKEVVWDLISDLANYHKFAPNIDKVSIIQGQGEGLVRQCSHGKESWTETCSMWKEGAGYSFIVDTEAPDFPYPLSYMKGSWELDTVDKLYTRLEMTFEIKYKTRYQQVMLHPIMKLKFTKTVNKLLNNWREELIKMNSAL